jgi:hypothetical protein
MVLLAVKFMCWISVIALMKLKAFSFIEVRSFRVYN